MAPSRSTVMAHSRTRGENSTRKSRQQAARGSFPHTRGPRPLPTYLPTYPPIVGSFPHTRGRLGLVHGWQDAYRPIPAHTGTTAFCGPVRHEESAHPRTRGEHRRTEFIPEAYTGSFPHTRGRHGPGCSSVAGSWLIPAHTGTMICPEVMCWKNWAHSRTHGDHYRSVVVLSREFGSFPHTRGPYLLTRHDTRAKPKNYSVSTRIHI